MNDVMKDVIDPPTPARRWGVVGQVAVSVLLSVACSVPITLAIVRLGGLASTIIVVAAWVRGVPYVTLARMVVNIGIAHSAAVQIERMVEQSSVSFRSGPQLTQEVGEQ